MAGLHWLSLAYLGEFTDLGLCEVVYVDRVIVCQLLHLFVVKH